jgi:dTDP-4-dehydrorhamnose 3,5-epimerase
VIFEEAPLRGAYVIEVEPSFDERGSFARTYCEDAFAEQGLTPCFVQASLSHNRLAGTLRGLHYQIEPHAEAKVVSCIQGAIHDVIVDLRPGSPTYGRSFAAELDAASHRALYVPKGFAHGFVTLAPDSIVSYLISARYQPEAARGVRFDDPALGIDWPVKDPIVSARDRALPLLSELSP